MTNFCIFITIFLNLLTGMQLFQSELYTNVKMKKLPTFCYIWM